MKRINTMFERAIGRKSPDQNVSGGWLAYRRAGAPKPMASTSPRVTRKPDQGPLSMTTASASMSTRQASRPRCQSKKLPGPHPIIG
ncbi:MAG: hypothetical protein FWD17_12195, partial [Polyangiaceae bacterium]|nr:hypothetical protein [Polyangiaceae bacterium]